MAETFGLISSGYQKKQVPLKNVAVSGRIKGYVFGLETKLTYLNSSDDPLEVVFRFPVDESSAVVGLEAKINGRTIKGEVREKEEARQMYDDALSSGLTAALGEEKTKDIFSLALGNLAPKGEAEIVLKLCGEMPLDKNIEAAHFSLPAVLKPRYTPAGSTDPLADIGGEGGQVEKGSAPAVSSFSIIVDRAEGVSSITSPTHDIKARPRDDGTAEVTLTSSRVLDKDLVILVQYQYCHTPRATVEKGKKEKGNQLMSDPAVMLEFFPKFTSLQAACEFLFVVDRSGSMQGVYINSAKETLVLFLKSIPPGCYFNIIGFGSSYKYLFPSSVPYNQSNLDIAMKHAQYLQADLGGTELFDPLQFVFNLKPLSGLPRQVFVLTDGSVSNTDACINLTKKNVHVARVFTFGIGSGASTELVKGLARAGNGSAEFIKEGERLQGKVIGSLKKALQPSVTDVELKFSVPGGIKVFQAPYKIPPVFNGEKLVSYGLLKGAGSDKSGQCKAVLRGKMLGSDVEHRIDFLLEEGSLPSSDMPVVHQLAAKSLIQDWESGQKDRKAAIVKLSIESSVVSSHTSYIAVDEDQDKPIEGAIKTYDLTADAGSNIFMNLMAPAGAPMPQSFFLPQLLPQSLPQSFGFMGGSHLLGASCPPPPPPPGASMGGGLPPPPPPNFMGGGPPQNSAASFSYDCHDMLIDCFDDAPPSPPTQRFVPTSSRSSNTFHSSTKRSFGDTTSSSSNTSAPVDLLSGDLFGDISSSLLMPVSSDAYTTTTGFGMQNTLGNTSSLSRLITLQTAEGSWILTDALASVFDKSLTVLKSSCPSGCSEVVWATVLALALLETKYSSQHDEWELLSMKSEMWLQGQVLPTGTTIASLTEKAKKVLA